MSARSFFASEALSACSAVITPLHSLNLLTIRNFLGIALTGFGSVQNLSVAIPG